MPAHLPSCLLRIPLKKLLARALLLQNCPYQASAKNLATVSNDIDLISALVRDVRVHLGTIGPRPLLAAAATACNPRSLRFHKAGPTPLTSTAPSRSPSDRLGPTPTANRVTC